MERWNSRKARRGVGVPHSVEEGVVRELHRASRRGACLYTRSC